MTATPTISETPPVAAKPTIISCYTGPPLGQKVTIRSSPGGFWPTSAPVKKTERQWESDQEYELRQRNRWDGYGDEYFGGGLNDPDETELSEIAEAWLDQQRNSAPGKKVFCGHCGSTMHTEKLGQDSWQHTCSACGTSGPRADSPDEALAMALDLFPD